MNRGYARSTDHKNDSTCKNCAGGEIQAEGTTESNKDKRARRKCERRRFTNGSEVNQDVRSADNTNNDNNAGDGNTRRRRHRFPNGSNLYLCIHSLLQIMNDTFLTGILGSMVLDV